MLSLDHACGGDEDLRADVESLLAASESAESFLRAPIDDGDLDRIATAYTGPLVGKTVGKYRITSWVATGGMGDVYRAVRADGEFEQEVAVKVLKGARVCDRARAWFHQERQTLANLRHPGIIQLFDGGMTDDGTPYLVMEFVDGKPIDCYCDENRMSITERLMLFCNVCSAVQFAHQNLVVHRDLKPGNILVAKDGQPKLLDFGVAKLLDAGSVRAITDATVTLVRG